jgi:hypothetical protein
VKSGDTIPISSPPNGAIGMVSLVFPYLFLPAGKPFLIVFSCSHRGSPGEQSFKNKENFLFARRTMFREKALKIKYCSPGEQLFRR